MSKDARVLARRYYQDHGRVLSDDCRDLSLNCRGVVVMLPTLVALMKPVLSGDELSFLPLSSSPADADAWYVHLLVGDVQLACALAARLEFLPRLCFQRSFRGDRMHCLSWSRFIQSY